MNKLRAAGLERRAAILQGNRERLRPILMTALTTLLSLIPMVVQKPSLGGVYYYSMALVIMGGLFVSSFLTTILLPTNTTLVEDSFAQARRFLAWLGRTLRLSGRSKAAAPAASIE